MRNTLIDLQSIGEITSECKMQIILLTANGHYGSHTFDNT